MIPRLLRIRNRRLKACRSAGRIRFEHGAQLIRHIPQHSVFIDNLCLGIRDRLNVVIRLILHVFKGHWKYFVSLPVGIHSIRDLLEIGHPSLVELKGPLLTRGTGKNNSVSDKDGYKNRHSDCECLYPRGKRIFCFPFEVMQVIAEYAKRNGKYGACFEYEPQGQLSSEHVRNHRDQISKHDARYYYKSDIREPLADPRLQVLCVAFCFFPDQTRQKQIQRKGDYQPCNGAAPHAQKRRAIRQRIWEKALYELKRKRSEAEC